MRSTYLLALSLTLALSTPSRSEVVDADLLIVGGTEAGVAAAVQAARLGVARVVLVNDIEWLGGQFSAEAVGAVDEWTLYRGKRANFPRSGIFLEVICRIRQHNGEKYGLTNPGNSFCASETIEPAAAARIFADLLAPYGEKGSKQVRTLWPYQPVQVERDGPRVAAVVFAHASRPEERLTVKARLTIDASDWGDVIRLSGAKYAAGPDLKARFGEEHAPAGPLGEHAHEMNPLTYCLVLREAGKEAVIPKPPHYDERRYLGTTSTTLADFTALGWPKQVTPMRVPPFVDADYPEGTYSRHFGLYTHRRLIDRHHNRLPAGTEKVLLNWPTQDYPLYQFPKHVADALEAAQKGASRKNVVDMTPAQRRIVFDDARDHALGMLYHLQTTVHKKTGDYPQSFRYMELSDEFGTPDRLPPKPYVREGLRLEALYVLREQDLRMRGREPGWARAMVHDSVFGFQFNIDFHPTRRAFLKDDPAGPWACYHTSSRNWSLHTDRAGFPYRSLVPIERDGLLGASKNLGVSSIVSSAVRLHGQMMMTGQASATAAFLCLREQVEPRDLARNGKLLRELQLRLVRAPRGAPGVLLWPYQDVSPEELYFEAVNLLAVRGILTGDPDSVDFQPLKPVMRRELARALARAARSLETAKPYHRADDPVFSDVGKADADRVVIESLQHWGALGKEVERFRPDEPADWKTLYTWMKGLGWKASEGLARSGELPLTRSELALHLWAALRDQPEHFPDLPRYLQPDHDADGDGIPDRDDALPFDRDNDGTSDRLDPRGER
jgi:hypothetical protein